MSEWIEVRETPTYKRTTFLAEFDYGGMHGRTESIDLIEITEFDDYTFTKSIRFNGNVNDAGKENHYVQSFGGVHRTDDPDQQILGVLNRYDVDTETTPWTFTDATNGPRSVAAFDLNQAVRLFGLEFNQTADSGISDFPDWQRTDVLVEMGE